ncbi:hypothetical protein DFJ77DRAFT_527822 [Powellomyces hirtus]|nr:hypothetical protein DFJ77DRAFT_527822 [Powellomyces hirtus]
MQFMLLLLLGPCLVSALTTAPNIYEMVGPITAAINPGDAPQPPTNPFKTRYADAPDANRVAILLPNYVQTPNWLGLVHGLRTIGVPAKVVNATSQLAAVPVTIIYTGTTFTWTPTAADVANLQNFVKRGGHLIAMSNIPASLKGIFGVTSVNENAGGTRSAVNFVNVEGANPVVLRGMNFTNVNDYIMTIWDDAATGGIPTAGYRAAQTLPAVTALANYIRRLNDASQTTTTDTSLNKMAFTMFKPTGYAGYAYAIGVDLGYWYFRAMSEDTQIGYYYVGQYYPSYDTILRIIKNIFIRTNDFMTLWPVPYNKGLNFVTTWDLDTAIAYPHGLAIAAAAVQAGANGNFNMHTKYVSDAYEDAYFQYGIPYIYQMTAFGTDAAGRPLIGLESHSVSHSPNAVSFPMGSPAVLYDHGKNVTGAYFPAIYVCDPKLPNGVPNNGQICYKGGAGSNFSFWTTGGSIFGEVRLSKFLIDSVLEEYGSPARVQSYRPGNLAFAKTQPQVCAALGIVGGSSCAANAHNTHLPIHMTHNRQPFAEVNNYEFPLSVSDGDMKMSSEWYPGSDFHLQSIRARQIASYGGIYNILIHPSDLMFDKIQFQTALHDHVRPYAYFTNTTGLAWWWRGRDYVEVNRTIVGGVVKSEIAFQGPVDGLTIQVPKTWILTSVEDGYKACQAQSFDGTSLAVVFTTTKAGTATLMFSIQTAGKIAATFACPDFTPPRNPQCLGYEVLVASFMDKYTERRQVNELILDTKPSPNLFTQYTDDGRLLLQASSDITSYATRNYWYTTLAKYCFDVAQYTFVTFDLVAPRGSDFFISLLAMDAKCSTQQPTSTFLRISDYTTLDGTNRSVAIPIADFQPALGGQFVQSLYLSNLAPKATTFYIDNIVFNKRCYIGPGETTNTSATDRGLVVDSLSSIDRWVTGLNTLGGDTDTKGMRFARMPFLNALILEPASAESYFYSHFPTLFNATQYDTLVITLASCPPRSSFGVTLSSGVGGVTRSTVNSTTYSAALPTTPTPQQLRVPLSAFANVDVTQLYGLRMASFYPMSLGSTFTVVHIALTMSNGTTTPPALPQPAACAIPPLGLTVNNFCNYKEYVTQLNALNGSTGDAFTATTYYPTPGRGRVSLTASPTGSTFWHTVLGPTTTGCFDASTAATGGPYTFLSLKIGGPATATARVVLNAGTGSRCTGGIAFAGNVVFKGLDNPVVITLPLIGVAGLNRAYLQSLYIDSWSATAPQGYEIYWVTLNTGTSTTPTTPLVQTTIPIAGGGGTPAAPLCATCPGTSVAKWCGATSIPTTNTLGGVTSDDGTMQAQFIGNGGVLQLVPRDTQSYWYTLFGTTPCTSAGTHTALQITVTAPAGSSFDIALRYKTDTACTTTAPVTTVNSAAYAVFDGTTPTTLVIPFTDFNNLAPTRLSSLSLQSFSQPAATYAIACISLTTAPSTPPTKLCPTCPAPAVLDFCTNPTPNTNALGGTSSDDNTMAADPVVTNMQLALVPQSGSYWYTILPCTNVAGYTYLILTVTVPAAATFAVEIQTATTAGCPAGSPFNKAAVPITPYITTTTTTSPPTQTLTLSIPLSAFSAITPALDFTRVSALAFNAFDSSAAGVPYSIACVYWSLTAPPPPAGLLKRKARAAAVEEDDEDAAWEEVGREKKARNRDEF